MMLYQVPATRRGMCVLGVVLPGSMVRVCSAPPVGGQCAVRPVLETLNTVWSARCCPSVPQL